MKYFFFILPFISFIFGYLFLSEYLYRSRKVQCIDITGKTINEIIPWLSETGISLLIDEYIYDNSKKNGTIIKQYPIPSTIISYQAPIHCIITKKIDRKILLTENFIGKIFSEIEPILNKNNILYKKIYIESFYPKNVVFSCGWDENEKELTIYISISLYKKYLICDLNNFNCEDLKNNYKNLNFKCINTNDFENHNLKIKNYLPHSGKILKDYGHIYLEH